jgi:hypothetical protein
MHPQAPVERHFGIQKQKSQTAEQVAQPSPPYAWRRRSGSRRSDIASNRAARRRTKLRTQLPYPPQIASPSGRRRGRGQMTAKAEATWQTAQALPPLTVAIATNACAARPASPPLPRTTCRLLSVFRNRVAGSRPMGWQSYRLTACDVCRRFVSVAGPMTRRFNTASGSAFQTPIPDRDPDCRGDVGRLARDCSQIDRVSQNLDDGWEMPDSEGPVIKQIPKGVAQTACRWNGGDRGE